MERDEKSQNVSDSISKLQPDVEFCLFCNGTGQIYESILLRMEPCKHCQGTGE